MYGGVAELSVYIKSASRGIGLGKQLFSILVSKSEESGIWTLQAGIFPKNKASLISINTVGSGWLVQEKKSGRSMAPGEIRSCLNDVVKLWACEKICS